MTDFVVFKEMKREEIQNSENGFFGSNYNYEKDINGKVVIIDMDKVISFVPLKETGCFEIHLNSRSYPFMHLFDAYGLLNPYNEYNKEENE